MYTYLGNNFIIGGNVIYYLAEPKPVAKLLAAAFEYPLNNLKLKNRIYTKIVKIING